MGPGLPYADTAGMSTTTSTLPASQTGSGSGRRPVSSAVSFSSTAGAMKGSQIQSGFTQTTTTLLIASISYSITRGSSSRSSSRLKPRI